MNYKSLLLGTAILSNYLTPVTIESNKLETYFQDSKIERGLSIDDENAIEILQREYAITSGKTDKPVLQTWGALTCVAVTLYDKETKLGMLAHIDGTTNVKSSFEQIFEELMDLGVEDISSLEARVFGGMKSISEEEINYITGMFDYANIDIVENDTLNSSIENFTPPNIQFDTKNGKVEDYKEGETDRLDFDEHNSYVFGRERMLKRHKDSLTVKSYF